MINDDDKTRCFSILHLRRPKSTQSVPFAGLSEQAALSNILAVDLGHFLRNYVSLLIYVGRYYRRIAESYEMKRFIILLLYTHFFRRVIC